MKKTVLLLLFAATLAGCRKEEIFLRSYVSAYGDCNEINLYKKISADNMIVVSAKVNSWCSYESTDYFLKETYDELCMKHGDMTYNRKFRFIPANPPYLCSKIGVDFVSIEIVSDSDYDETHPAGVSLGDIVVWSAWSAKPFIDSGYSCKEPTRIEVLVSELLPEDLVLLGGSSTNTYYGGYVIGELVFQSVPTLEQKHTFTVTMTADDGRVFSNSIEMNF